MAAAKRYVFVHVPRTSGSTVWSMLAETAFNRGIGICDLYYESNRRFGHPHNAGEVLREVLPVCNESAYIFHHHTRENISPWFDGDEVVYATVLRDPLDRFISDVFHSKRLQALARGDAVGLNLDLVELAVDQVELDNDAAARLRPGRSNACALLRSAAAQRHFANYYVNFFWDLCIQDGRRVGKNGFVAVRNPAHDPRPAFFNFWRKAEIREAIRHLASTLHRKFAVIERFGNPTRSYANIAKAFGMFAELNADQSNRVVMKGHAKPHISEKEKRKYANLFELDYLLLEELNRLESQRERVAA